jgi:Mg2+ and Co2+ transporter CorA
MACTEAKLMRTFVAILAAGALGVTGAALTGCDRNDTPGEHIDEAIDETNDAIDDAADEIDDAVDDLDDDLDNDGIN